MAHLTGLSQSFLSMLESGARRLTNIDKIIDFLTGLDTPADLAPLPLPMKSARRAREEPSNPLAGELDPSLPWTSSRMVAALNDAVGGGSVERRKFLTVSGFALTAFVHHWGAEEAEPLMRAGHGSRISNSLLEKLQGTTDELRIMDASAGSGTLTQMGRAHLELLKLIIKQSSYNEVTGRTLAAIVADTATQTGWFAFDSGQHDEAQRYFLAAVRAAKASGDIRLGAGALSYMAIHGYSTGAPQDAVTAARAAREKVKGISTPFLEAMLLTRQARGHAKLGERQATLAALGHAAELCAQGRSENDPSWLYWINEGEIHGQAGSSHLDLGDPQRAVDSLTRAREALNPTDLRTRGLILARAATALIRGGEAEAGVTTAHTAIDMAEQLNSARLTDHIHDVIDELSPVNHKSYARDLLERAAAMTG
ncbi:XRE family transcriptional regulator [Streptomyces flavidovirens]|uniref:XRE family transcriptional regulator n=1 Tax=Streptomyces flavidovirens TaxID=67298 RepID=A0ABW6RB14_9ACTN